LLPDWAARNATAEKMRALTRNVLAADRVAFLSEKKLRTSELRQKCELREKTTRIGLGFFFTTQGDVCRIHLHLHALTKSSVWMEVELLHNSFGQDFQHRFIAPPKQKSTGTGKYT